MKRSGAVVEIKIELSAEDVDLLDLSASKINQNRDSIIADSVQRAIKSLLQDFRQTISSSVQ